MNNKDEILKMAVNIYGVRAQEDTCIEECSELIKAILKYRRLNENEKQGEVGEQKRSQIREEIADVQIMIDQMRIVYGDTKNDESFKIKRLKERLELRDIETRTSL